MTKKEKKEAPTIETMTAKQLIKHIASETARAERLAAAPTYLGRGWKMAAESTLAGVTRAKDRLATLDGGK